MSDLLRLQWTKFHQIDQIAARLLKGAGDNPIGDFVAWPIAEVVYHVVSDYGVSLLLSFCLHSLKRLLVSLHGIEWV